MTFLDRVFEALNQARSRFVIVGGVAVVLHGHARFTKDLDLILDFEPDSARRAIAALVALGLRPGVPVDPADFADAEVRGRWASERGMMVFSLRDWDNPLHVVDLFVEHPMDFDSLWDRADVMQVAGGEVRVAAIPDLLELKRAAAGPGGHQATRADRSARTQAMSDRQAQPVWPVGWEGAAESDLAASLRSTPAQRLEWLAEAQAFTLRAGAWPGVPSAPAWPDEIDASPADSPLRNSKGP